MYGQEPEQPEITYGELLETEQGLQNIKKIKKIY